MHIIIVYIILFIYIELAIFVTVYTYDKAIQGYEILIKEENKLAADSKIIRNIKLQAAAVGIFFPISLVILAAHLAAEKK